MNIYANIIDKKDHVLTEHENFDQLASIKILSIMDQIHCIANVLERIYFEETVPFLCIFH